MTSLKKARYGIQIIIAAFFCGTAVAHAPIRWPIWWGGPGGGFVPVGGIRPHNLVMAPVNPRLEISLDNPYRSPYTEPQVSTQALFAGVSWSDPSFADDQISGVTAFLSNFDESPYAKLRREYAGSKASIGFVGSTVIPKPIHITQDSVGGDDNEITSTLGFVCDAVSAGDLVLGNNGKDNLLIFTDVKRNQSNSCAFRMSAVSCPGMAGASFRFTVFFDMTEDRQCQVPLRPLGQSMGLSSLANLAARSLMETQTDPDFVGYEDAWGNNLDDLCAWSFHVPFVAFPDGSHWKLQDLWSNEAYRDGSGHPNQDGKKGCVNAQ